MALVAGAALALLLVPPSGATRKGTVLVLATSVSGADVNPAVRLRLAGRGEDLGTLRGAVPPAPEQRRVAAVEVAPGRYAGILAGAEAVPAEIVVVAGQVTPVLVVTGGQGIRPAGVYAGNSAVNLGLAELGGKLAPLPDFQLTGRDGRALDRAALLGRPVVLAAFHTTCRETCPLYTGVLLQLRRQAGDRVHIVEVTTDPVTDTPGVLDEYARRVGADWTFATGTPAQVAAFWSEFGVTLSSGDSHDSLLVLADEHGFQRAAWRGVPDVGGTLPPALFSSLSGQGLAEVRSRGEGWSAQAVVDALGTVAAFGGARQSEPGGRPAPDFVLAGFDGRPLTMGDLRGRPAVINFFAAWCPPCGAELPLFEAAAQRHPQVQVLLVDWHNDDPGRARQLLDRARARTPRAAIDFDGSVGRQFGVAGLPTTVFVRADGTIDSVVRAQLDEATLAGHISQLGAG